jgi:predicted SPOUT superfamily RNA methylase MTH1
MNSSGTVVMEVAIPDSSLVDEQTKRDKSIKISQISRACCIFRVGKIYIYRDKTSVSTQKDRKLLKAMLTYLDTPQYLRRKLFPIMDELEYAGILHPVKAPHHKSKKADIGDIRVAVLIEKKGRLYADIGLNSLSIFKGSGYAGKKINAKIISIYPELVTREADKREIKEYWGYNVVETSLLNLLESNDNTEIIITSRDGKLFRNYENNLSERIKTIKTLLLIFGSPRNGVPEILKAEGRMINQYPSKINMFPFQGTETVRLEEAILGTLAIMNHYLSKQRSPTIELHP